MLKILKSTSIIILASFLIAIIFLPLATNATDQLVPCGSGNDPNNRCTLCHLIIGIHRVLNYGYYVAFVVALACVTFAGIMYLVSTGDEKLMTSAKGFIKSSLIGFAVIFCAWIIVNSILLFFSTRPGMGIGRTNWYTFECAVPTATSALPPAVAGGAQCRASGSGYDCHDEVCVYSTMGYACGCPAGMSEGGTNDCNVNAAGDPIGLDRRLCCH